MKMFNNQRIVLITSILATIIACSNCQNGAPVDDRFSLGGDIIQEHVCAYDTSRDISSKVISYLDTLVEKYHSIEPEDVGDSIDSWASMSVSFTDLNVDTFYLSGSNELTDLYDLELNYYYSRTSWGELLSHRTEVNITVYGIDISGYENLSNGDFLSIRGVFTHEEYKGFRLDLQIFADVFDFYMDCAEIIALQKDTLP
jgi:hypothetical protein